MEKQQCSGGASLRVAGNWQCRVVAVLWSEFYHRGCALALSEGNETNVMFLTEFAFMSWTHFLFFSEERASRLHRRWQNAGVPSDCTYGMYLNLY